jgi:hypothetical protein
MIEDYPYARIDFSRDLEISVPPGESEGRWVSHHLCSFFLFAYVIFMSFLLYISFFCMPEYLTDKRLLHAYVGSVRPADYARNRRHLRPEATVGTVGGAAVVGNLLDEEAERVLRQVERNFTALTPTVSMAEIEDLLPSMQPHVVGAPQTWV